MWNYYGYNMMGWGFGSFMMIIFWVIVALLIYILVKGSLGAHKNCCGNNNAPNKALDVLKERYAKGEINKEEFEAKKKDISQ